MKPRNSPTTNEERMKLNVNAPIKNLQGMPMVDSGSKQPISFKMVAVEALLQDDRDATGQQKLERFQLASRMHDCKDDAFEITPEDAAMVKDLTARMYGPLISGQVWLLLNRS